MIEIVIAIPSEFNDVNVFYKSVNYGGDAVDASEKVVLAKQGKEIVGAVRFKTEQGVNLLRGMQIRKEFQRQGIGSQMLKLFVEIIGKRTCYCLPHSYLKNFYEQIGFKEVEAAEAPGFLQDRMNTYNAERKYNLIIMKR